MGFALVHALAALKQRARNHPSAAGSKRQRAVVITHDNPDPDSLAAGLGLKAFLATHGFDTTLAFGGIIGRAENRAMVRELKIDLQPIDKLNLDDFAIIALVDTQPGTGNNSLPQSARVDMVIDHHPPRPSTDDIPWRDIRPEFGATATIVYDYLKNANITLDPMLATAMLYAVKSETRELGREAGQPERDAYVDLIGNADFSRLHSISNPKVGREHFVAVDRAIRSAICWGELIAVNVGSLDFPDLVAEVADLMLPYEKAHWVLCVGQHRGVVYLSVRTDLESATAGTLIRKMVGGKGASGGHGMIAGGRLFAEVRDDEELKVIYDDLVARFVAELKISSPPTPLL